ncbi:hypothetical protein NE237_000357 [Protea cynaroides]|uniref:Phytocyanin domain-containing protein n=1 Tax=Protea cynaroides TaxID=273540 RepID=A0A9Q0KR94_9MAGN|nr:hypothetical protein NE237_000357 [Protea cynaroides]
MGISLSYNKSQLRKSAVVKMEAVLKRGCERSRRMDLLLVLITVMVSLSVVQGERGVAAEVHHIVGGDRGWEITSDISAWSADRLFRVGDTIWFAYSTGTGESIVEVGSRDELEACDVSNPIRLYTDGLDSIILDGVGSRFFTSGSPDSCRKGLKLNVDVLPHKPTQIHGQMKPLTTTTIPVREFVNAAVAAGPTTPSAAVPLQQCSSSTVMAFFALLLFWAFL